MSERHGTSCARRWRERAHAEGWGVEETVDAICGCCGVSRLRAHRLARGWTLRTAVAEFHAMADQMPGAPRLDEDQLRLWETRPNRRPRAGTIDLLARLYRSNAHGLGLAGDYRDTSATDGADRPNETDRARSAGRWSRRAAGGLEELVSTTRRAVDRTLAQATVSAVQLDLLDERVQWLRREYLYTPPATMLATLITEVEEVQSLAAERQPATTQTRLSALTATLATLVADALMKFGRLTQARAWYATARTAADDSGDRQLRSRVRAQAAMLPYYYGPLDAAATLAREARLLARGPASVTSAFAAAALARTLARQQNTAGAETAIRAAQDDFEHCDHSVVDDAFAFPERRFLLYLSGAYTFLGRPRQAATIQHRALALYPDDAGIDPALLRLEQAICLAHDHELTEACRLAEATYLCVEEDQRTAILGARARHVLEVVPPSMRDARAARRLTEALALPAAGR